MDEFSVADLSEKEYSENEAFAKGLYLAEVLDGKEFSGRYTTDTLMGQFRAGYGRTDDYGFFEYPLNVDQETGKISISTTQEF